jgi:hypothetical protein
MLDERQVSPVFASKADCLQTAKTGRSPPSEMRPIPAEKGGHLGVLQRMLQK